MQKKNILYIFNDNSLGGAGQSLLDTLKEIKKEVNPIVIMQEKVCVKDRFEALNIRCYEIRFPRDYVKIGNASNEKKKDDFRQSYEAAIQILPIIEKEKIQLVHINSSVSYFGAIAALMADIPFVWHIRELMEEHFSCEFLNNELKKALYIRSDKLISISDYVKHKYYEKYSVNTQKIYNGLDIEKFKVNLDEDMDFENVFLVAAVVSHEKGQFDAIRATEILIGKGYSDVKLIIVGGGADEYTWALRKYVKIKKLDSNISIFSFQSDLSKLRRMASYAITCSQNEALGRVTIESMLAGNLVIGAKSGGTIEIIGENEERGVLYELHNVEELANTMIRVMQYSKKKKNQIVKNAQIYAEHTFSSRQYCRELLKVYDEVIESHKPKNQDHFLRNLKDQYEQIKNIEMCKNQEVNIQYLKLEAAFELLSKWLEIKQKGYNLVEYFKTNHIQSVAIYGMAMIGRRLYDELENSDIQIKYLLDRNPKGMEKILKFSLLDKEKLEVDVIVVTVAATEHQIVKEIQTMGYKNVIGLSDILCDFIWKIGSSGI